MAMTHDEAFAAQAARSDVPSGMLGVHRWYLRRKPADPGSTEFGVTHDLIRCETPPLAYYRFLYNTVGEDWLWFERRKMADAELAAALASDAVSVHVLFEHGAPAGFFELNRDGDEAVDLAYFGLMPWAVGRGLGPSLLRAAIHLGGGASGDMTVNTCTLDHPKALAMYQAAGFEIEREIQFEDPDPRVLGLAPKTAHPKVAIRP